MAVPFPITHLTVRAYTTRGARLIAVQTRSESDPLLRNSYGHSNVLLAVWGGQGVTSYRNGRPRSCTTS
eukprot:2002907-Rhodomonas_salina.2